jgi:uncharacterized protein YndB with AHSA1/START domain
MKKILLSVLAGIVLLVGALFALAATKADTFSVRRSAAMHASPARVFVSINDLRNWRGWSPYEHLDPDMKRTFSGSPAGVGAVYAWDGNTSAGSGTMEITESTPPSRIVIALHFTRPFEGNNTVEFTLEPHGDSTTVIWAMHGPVNFPAKVIGLFVSMDTMIGTQFEEGLANLRRASSM